MAPPTDWKRTILAPVLALFMLASMAALPAIAAAQKTIGVQVTLPSPNAATAATAGVNFSIKVTNTSPGSSNPNSLRVAVPSSPAGFQITGASIDGANSSRANAGALPPIINGAKTSVDFNSIDPIQQNQFITVIITATTPAICPAASVTSGDWTAIAYTGSTAGNNQQKFVTNSSVTTKTTLTQPGGCANRISFVSGFAPSDTTAGGTMSPVKVLVKNSSDTPVANNTVTLTGDIQNSGSVTASTGADGVAVFNTIKVSQSPTASASLTATEAGGQTVSGSFDITPATIAFVQQPTLTQFNQNITPAPTVKVSGAGGVGIEGVTVTMSIGTNPADGVLAGTLTSVTGNDGVATFTGLSIGPNDTVTSSGYTLSATATESGSVVSDAFAISNTIAGDCSPTCTATFPNGSTITAPGGTTLIIENNDPDFCSSISTVIAGTVTVIPSGTGDKLLTFVDPAGSAPSTEPFPQPGVTYPVCKGQDAGDPNPITLDYKFPEDRCINTGGPACIEDQYFQIGTLDLVTKVLISSADPTLKR